MSDATDKERRSHLESLRVKFESLVFYVAPVYYRFRCHHVAFLESRHVDVIMIVDHAAFLSDADSCSDVVTGDHTARNVCIEQTPNCGTCSRLEFVLEHDKT